MSSSDFSSSPSTPARTWRAGTLTYTSGGLVVLFLWLLFGDFAWSMRDRSVGPMAQWYLDHLGVPSLVFGLLVSSFPAAVGMVLGPVISVKSDRHRGRLGRRIPFLLVTTPLAAAGMIGLAVTPWVARWVHGHFPQHSEMLVSVACFAVFWAAFECATVATQAVFGGLINDVVPREFLGRFYGLFRAVSLVDGMIFNFWIMGRVPEHFTLILATVGVFYGAAFMWMCFKVREGAYPPPPEMADAGIRLSTTGAQPPREGMLRRRAAGMGRYFRECFSSRYYVSVFAMLTTAALTFGPVNIFALRYARSLGVDMDAYGKALALTYLISLGLSYPLGWLADRFHPLRVSLVTLAGYAVVAGWGSVWATTPASFLTAWVLHGVLSGCYLTSAASLAQRLFPHEKFAQYASAAGMLMAPAHMALAPLTGLAIDGTGGVYRHTFAIAGGLALLAFATAWRVHGGFMRLGGPRGYRAPE